MAPIRAKLIDAFKLLPWVAGGVVLLSSVIPLGWLALQVVGDPKTLNLLRPSAVRWDILLRTCGFSAIAATIAVGLAVPAGLTLGRRRDWTAHLIGFLLPITLLLPSLTYAYGWAQFFRLISGPLGRLLLWVGVNLDTLRESIGVNLRVTGPDAPAAFLVPAGPADVARCILSLAAWLWPIPAAAMAWSLRRADPAIREQAMLDNAERRITFRQLLGPALAGGLAVWMLAGQEFAVYEPTGISVVATEVRMVFETGSFSSAGNPITQSMGSTMFGGEGTSDNNSGPVSSGFTTDPRDVQQRAAAAAVATGLPMLLLTAIFGAIVASAAKRWQAEGDELQDALLPLPVLRGRAGEGASDAQIDQSKNSERGFTRQRSLPRRCLSVLAKTRILRAKDPGLREYAQTPASSASSLPIFLSLLVLLITVGTPLFALVLRHQRRLDLFFAWQEFGDLLLGSIAMAALAGMTAGVLAIAGAVRRPSWNLILTLASFLVGGQLLAIALIRLYNRPGLGWVYHAPPIMVMAYVGRFGWLPLIAAGATWRRPWRILRSAAELDGAGPGQIAWHLVWPLAWPMIAGSALLVLVLSLTEVPATVLASPYNPPQIVPMLMTWVHTLESDPMIEASLLMVVLVVAFSAAAVGLLSLRRIGWEGGIGVFIRRLIGLPASSARSQLLLLASLLVLSSTGCGKSGEPDAVWLETGTSPGQVVYPRALCYSPDDDTFWVIDRVARVQHLDSNGKFIAGWRMPDFALGKPVGVSVGPHGNLYIPDTHYHRVMVYSPAGELLRQWGELGKADGQFIFPTDVAFDEKGRVFVSEYGENDRIQVFDQAGQFLYKFGSFGPDNGQFARPESMVIDKDLVYVTDVANHRICVFRTDGSFVRNMGSVGSELGQFRFPYGLDIDAKGRLIVAEFGNNRVQLIDKETGRGLVTWGRGGREKGQFAGPWSVAVDKNGRVVTVDSGNNRLQVFKF